MVSNTTIGSYLRDASLVLAKCLQHQAEAGDHDPIGLRPLREHLEQLAVVVTTAGLAAALETNKAFSVSSPGRLLGRSRRTRLDRSRLAEGGRKGGLARSVAKQAAARSNGKRGGRPKRNRGLITEGLINDLFERLTMVAANPELLRDPAMRRILKELKFLPQLAKRQLLAKIEKGNVDLTGIMGKVRQPRAGRQQYRNPHYIIFHQIASFIEGLPPCVTKQPATPSTPPPSQNFDSSRFQEPGDS